MSKLKSDLADALVSSQNLHKFLALIRVGEGTSDPDGYRRMFGGELFTSFADHPRKAITKPLGGKTITSTAAGAYQILSRTWFECVEALDLDDFSPSNQDLAAVFLIRRRKALPAVLAGKWEEAIRLCNREWASLPGSPYGQPTLTMARALKTLAAAPDRSIEAPIAPDPVPTPPPALQPTPEPQPEKPVAPLIPLLASTLIDIFAPVAREKLSKEINRNTDTPQVADAIANGVIKAAREVTGKEDPLEAVAAVRSEPELVRRVEALTLDQLGGVLTLAERMSKIDEASVAAARDYARTDDFMIDVGWLKLKFIHLLSITFVSFAGWFVVETWATLTPELRGAVITLMVIAGWNGVKDFWMGSSDGSQRKTAELLKARDK